MNTPPEGLARFTRDPDQPSLFELEPDWRKEWWGMPEYTMGDASPAYSITINCLTLEDGLAIGKLLGLKLTAKSDSAWFPPQSLDQPKEWVYVSD